MKEKAKTASSGFYFIILKVASPFFLLRPSPWANSLSRGLIFRIREQTNQGDQSTSDTYSSIEFNLGLEPVSTRQRPGD